MREPVTETKSISDKDTSSAVKTGNFDPLEKQANLITKYDRHAQMLNELQESE